MLQFLLKRKLLVGLLVFLTFGIGLYSFSKLDRELFPDITFNQAMIHITTQEMPAEDIEQIVTEPVEQMLVTIEEVEDTFSTTTMHDSTIYVNLSGKESRQVVADIENKVTQITNQIDLVDDVLVMQAQTSGDYEFVLTISEADIDEMTSFANDIVKKRLEALKEVSEVMIAGAEEKEIVITLDEEKLKRYELSKDIVIQQIEQLNNPQTLGSLEKDPEKRSLRWHDTLQSKKDIENIPLKTNDGIKVLKEVANVKEETKANTNVAWKDGSTDFLLVQVARTKDVTAIDMTEAVRQEIANIKATFDNGIELDEVVAQADYVKNSIDGVKDNVIAGGIIAIVVLLLFLRNIRATIIVSLSIPASILLTFMTMIFLDYSFNLFTLIGLGLGIGMLVDAAIVVLESIFKKKQLGYNNLTAVIEGTKEVFGAVVASMLTTIVVFVPFVLLDEEVGKIAIILTVVIAVTLISSVLVAFTFIPVLSENFLKVKKKKRSRLRLIDRYGTIVSWLSLKKRRRIGIIGLFIIVLVSSFFLLARIPVKFMPDILDRYTEVVVELETGTTNAKKAEIAREIDQALKRIRDVESSIVMDNLGFLFVIVNMTDEAEKTMEQDKVNELIMENLRSLSDDFPIEYVMSTTDGIEDIPVELRIYGENFATLDKLADDVKERLEELSSISDAKIDQSEVSEQYAVTLREKKLKDANLSASEMYHFIQEQFADVKVGDIVHDTQKTPIIVRNEQTPQTKKELLNKTISNGLTEEKLSSFISLEKTDMVNEINRENGERYISIYAEIDEGQTPNVYAEINDMLENIPIDRDYAIEVVGDLEEQQEAMADLVIIFMIALFLVFLIMAVQFNSLKHPFVILFIVPFTITGVLIGLAMTQKEFNIMAGIGAIMLLGIVLNNGILLIDRIKQLREANVSLHDAVVDAGKDRIRPIFMTTLTTAGGMLPLALATDATSGYQASLAVVVISGLLFSTLITLILIPCIYLLLEDMNRGIRKLFRRNKKRRKQEVAS